MTGCVYLVGAGPGDPDLLTMKAYRLIQTADVVVYDRLVSDEIMTLVNPKADKIFVGKKLDYHSVPQDEINQILVEHAKAQKQVVRLKGGDPFIFGRGGEELETLIEHGVSFDVVPGITSASGCSTYAGIPLTHRDHAQSVQFIAGHLKKEADDINWRCLAQSQSTLVFYMGLKQAPYIQKNLLTFGLAPSTLCAIIEQGTTPRQKVFTAPLSELDQIATQAQSPSLIIIGSVVSLHERLYTQTT